MKLNLNCVSDALSTVPQCTTTHHHEGKRLLGQPLTDTTVSLEDLEERSALSLSCLFQIFFGIPVTSHSLGGWCDITWLITGSLSWREK